MRKRIVTVFMAMIFAGLAITGCGKDMTVTVNINDNRDSKQETEVQTGDETDESEEIVGMPNPMVPVEDDADFEEQLGIKLDTSYYGNQATKFIIGGKIAEVSYLTTDINGDDAEIILRATKDLSVKENPVEMLAGIYAQEVKDNGVVDIAVYDGNIEVSKVTADDYDIAYFEYNDAMYTITDDGVFSQMELGEIYDTMFAVVGAIIINPEEEGDSVDTIEPLEANVDLDNLEGTYSVKITEVNESDDGAYTVNAEVYTMDLYDTIDIITMKPGSILHVDGSAIAVEKVEIADAIPLDPDKEEAQTVYEVNGGSEEGGVDFIEYDEGTCRFFGFDDHASYTYKGDITLPLSTDAVIIDHASDFDTEPANTEGVTVKAKEFKNYFDEDIAQYNGYSYFYVKNTTITVENGNIVEIYRKFIP